MSEYTENTEAIETDEAEVEETEQVDVTLDNKPVRRKRKATDPRALATEEILQAIAAETVAQVEKWGVQKHPLVGGWPDRTNLLRRGYIARRNEAQRISKARNEAGTTGWDDILIEELYEALAETAPGRIEAELIQTAAVAVSAILAVRATK